MKKSKINAYLENTEAPEYKSSGASGFDLSVHFTDDEPYLSLGDVDDILNTDLNLIDKIYQKIYEGKWFVIPFEQFAKSLIHAVNITLFEFEGEQINLYEWMRRSKIYKVNVLYPYTNGKYPTNLYTELPESDEMQVRTRSGIASKTLIAVKLGTVDNDWRGNTRIICQNPTPYTYIIPEGYRLAQGVIMEKKRAVFNFVDNKDKLSKTDRGESGLGSSGTM